MKTLKKIQLKGVSEILSEKELKNVLGGKRGTYCWQCTDSAKSCVGSYDDCLNAFAEACPAGGAFYECELY